MGQQLVCGQIAWLAPVKDCLANVGSEVAKVEEPCEIGRADAFPARQCGKRHAVTVKECGIETGAP